MRPRFLAAVLALSVGGPLTAQDVPVDALAMASGRSMAEVLAGLPGDSVRLQELLAVAKERNLELEVAWARRSLADAGVQVEQGIFDPAFTLGWGAARDPNQAGSTGSWATGVSQALPWGTEVNLGLLGSRLPGTGGESEHDVDLAFSLRQPLLEGLGTRDANLREARALRDAAAADLRRSQEYLAAQVEMAYWGLGQAEAREAVLQRSLEIAEALHFRNRQLAERTLIPEVDVLTAASAVALRRSGVIAARQARLDAAEALLFLVWGEGASTRPTADVLPLKTVGSDSSSLPAPSAESGLLEEEALQNRWDLVAARAALRGASELEREASRTRLPSLDLDGGLSYSGAASSLGSSLPDVGEKPSWSLGLSFSQPLFNRRDRGRSRGAELAVEIRRLELALAESAALMEVRGALRALAAGRERLIAAQEASSLGLAQLEAERRRLDLGLGDSFRLLQTEQMTVQAEMEAVAARFDLARAGTRYRLAMGGSGP